MIPNHEPNSLETTGEIVGAFGVSEEDEAHVLGILRDQVYSDKILAVIREYTSNAWDANRSAGRGETPVVVHLPTFDEPWFAVTDEGPGLSAENVVKIFSKYGKSTKRDDPNQVGMLGIGSKSAFSYVTSFTVTSRHGGKARTYVCALEESDLGTVAFLSEEDCGETTGVTVQVAVRPGDVDEFRTKAADLYAHFHPTPACGVAVTERRATANVVKLDGGFEAWVEHNIHSPEMTAVMGCVPYHVDLSEIELPEEQEWAKKADLTVQFPIGAVQFVASREELRYTQKTKDAIVAALAEVTDKLVVSVIEAVDSETTSAFAKRIKLLQINQLGLFLPDEYDDLAKSKVQICDRFDDKIPFTIYHSGNTVGQVMLSRDLRFYLQDTQNKLTGYALGSDDYVICPRGKSKDAFEAARAAFDKHVEACGLSGVPIKLISTASWSRPWNSRSSRSSKTAGQARAYKADMLVIDPDHFYGSNSEHWAPVRREPLDSDVYVELVKFEDEEGGNIYHAYRVASEALGSIGEKLPPVYGYKKGKGPARRGTTFSAWWAAKVKEVLARPAVRAACIAHEAEKCLPHVPPARLDELVASLGEDHPLTAPYVQARKNPAPEWAKHWYPLSGFKVTSAPGLKAITRAIASYPLLRSMDELTYHSSRAHWVEYVRLIDADRLAKGAVPPAIPVDGLLSAAA